MNKKESDLRLIRIIRLLRKYNELSQLSYIDGNDHWRYRHNQYAQGLIALIKQKIKYKKTTANSDIFFHVGNIYLWGMKGEGR